MGYYYQLATITYEKGSLVPEITPTNKQTRAQSLALYNNNKGMHVQHKIPSALKFKQFIKLKFAYGNSPI